MRGRIGVFFQQISAVFSHRVYFGLSSNRDVEIKFKKIRYCKVISLQAGGAGQVTDMNPSLAKY